MSAYDELRRTGQLGRQTIERLVAIVAQTGRRDHFPPPEGHREWDDTAAFDFIGAMIDGKNGTEFFVSLAVTATDEDSLIRLLRRTVRNWMIDQAKATVVGRMRRRLGTLLEADPRFERSDPLTPGHESWALSGTNTAWHGDDERLLEAAASLQTEPLTNLNTAGRTSAANKRVLTGYIGHLLRSAGGALPSQLIARTVVSRFGLDEGPIPGAADPEFLSSGDPSVEQKVLRNEIRDAVLAQLDARGEVTLALWEQPDLLARRFGVPTDTARAWIDDLLDRIRPFCLRGEDGAEGLRLAVDVCSKRI